MAEAEGVGVDIIYVLLVAHFVGDFICQSDWMALSKSKLWVALAYHVGVYISVVSLVVAAFQPPSPYPYVELLQFGAWVSVNSFAHFVQDAITSRINARLWQANERHWFFVGIGADQLFHYVTLFVTAGWWLR